MKLTREKSTGDGETLIHSPQAIWEVGLLVAGFLLLFAYTSHSLWGDGWIRFLSL